MVRKKAAVCGEERCVTSLKTAAKETIQKGTFYLQVLLCGIAGISGVIVFDVNM